MRSCCQRLLLHVLSCRVLGLLCPGVSQGTEAALTTLWFPFLFNEPHSTALLLPEPSDFGYTPPASGSPAAGSACIRREGCQAWPARAARSPQAPRPCSQQSHYPFAGTNCTPRPIQADALRQSMPPAPQYLRRELPFPPRSISPGFACPLPPRAPLLLCLLNPFSFLFGLLDFAFQADAFTFTPARLLPSHFLATWSMARCLQRTGCSPSCHGLCHGLCVVSRSPLQPGW